MAISFLTSAVSSADATSYTFSSLSLGAAASDRVIIVAIAARAGGTPSITGVTVAGVAAVRVGGQRNTASSNLTEAALWRAVVPSGTSGNVVVTTSATFVRLGVSLYRLTGVQATASITGGQSTAAGVDPTATITVPAAGAAIAVTYNATGTNHQISTASGEVVAGSLTVTADNVNGDTIWTGLTENADALLEASTATSQAMYVAVWSNAGTAHAGAAVLSGVGTLAGLGKGSFTSAAALSGIGSAIAAASIAYGGASELVGAGGVSATGRLSGVGHATLAGEGSIAASASAALAGSSVLAGAGGLEVQAKLAANAAAALAAIGTLTADGLVRGNLPTPSSRTVRLKGRPRIGTATAPSRTARPRRAAL